MKRIMNRIPITMKEILARMLIIFLVILLITNSDNEQREIITVVAFFLAFCGSLYLHKHLFPIIASAIFFFLAASLQDLLNENYTQMPITKTYWIIGDILLCVGVIDFVYKLIFKYKIKDG